MSDKPVLLVAAARSPTLFDAIALLGIGDKTVADNRPDGSRRRDDFASALEAENEPMSGTALLIRRAARSAGNDLQRVAAHARAEQPAPSYALLAAITARCLLVEGDADPVGPGERLAETIANCRRVTLKGVDHYAIPKDSGCLDAVLRFLEG